MLRWASAQKKGRAPRPSDHRRGRAHRSVPGCDENGEGAIFQQSGGATRITLLGQRHFRPL
eukprot:6903538-Alexandrium_andersonii.AAC.1